MSDHHTTTRAQRPAARSARQHRPTLLSLAAAAMLAAALGVQAQPASRDIDIPAQPLDKAIAALARQAGVRILFSTDLTENKQAPALKGSLTLQQALERLLAGSGLVLRATGDGGFTVAQQPPSTPAATPASTLPEVRVQAQSGQPGAVSIGYLPVRPSTGGNKLDLTIREQANVINIVPRESFEDRGATTVHQALETVAGIRPVSPAYTSGSGGIRSRGFENADVFVNGARLGAFGHPLDVANIEQLEVLKGPASIQYGLSDPGGTLNIVTKRPIAQPLAQARVIAGSFSSYRAELDVGGALGSGSNLLTRLNVAVEDNDEHRDFDKTRRFFIAPAVTWLIGNDTTLDLEFNYLRNRYRFNRGLGADPYILALPFGRSFGEPNQPLSINRSYSYFSNLEHRLGGSDWKLRQRIGYLRVDSDTFEVNNDIGPPDAAGDISRTYFDSFGRDRFYTVQHELAGAFETGAVRHKAVVGLEFSKSDFGYGFYSNADPARELAPINVFNPSYGGYVFPPRSELSDGGFPPEHYGNRVAALYADWQSALSPRWKLLAGLRYDRTRGFYETLDRSVNYGAGRANGLSPRAGVVWTPRPALDVFANYSTGFKPQIFADAAGTLFTEPEASRQTEAGLRYEFVPGRLRATASVYAITKRNVQVPDPADPTGTRSTLSGEQKSDGFELELAGAITPRWDITAGFARVDARVTKDTNAANLGSKLVDAPRNHLALFTKHSLGELLPGAWVGYGLARVDERVSSFFNPAFLLPAYTRHDLALGYGAGALKAQLNVGNVTGERIYYTHGNNIHLQPGRNVKATLEYRFE